MTNENKVFDMTIIGGGPVGMFAAFYAGMRGMSVKIIEALPQLGGQLTALYPEKYIYDVAGFPNVRAQELVDRLKEQMLLFPIDICTGQSVESVTKGVNEIFTLTTNEAVHYSRTILIAAGNGAFKVRKLEFEEEVNFVNKNLHYFINDLQAFKERNVLVLGGGDSAVDWALMLEPIASSVTIAHRRDKFRAHEHSVTNLKASSVNILTPYIPLELLGEEEITHVKLQHVKNEEDTILKEVDDVIVNYGFISSLGAIKDWNLHIEKNSIVVNSRMETNIPGIYAVGDICTYQGKVKLIISGFGEAPTAVSNAKVYIDPSAKIQAIHSTSLMENKKEAISTKK